MTKADLIETLARRDVTKADAAALALKHDAKGAGSAHRAAPRGQAL